MKPPVLSECICEMYDFKPFYSPWDVNNTKLNHCYECDAYNKGREHQRDKDVEWYGDMIVKVTERSIRAGETALNKVFKVQQKAIQQARQDTAREIFEEIEKRLPITNEWYVKDLIQELKSKFLIPPNPVGSADV